MVCFTFIQKYLRPGPQARCASKAKVKSQLVYVMEILKWRNLLLTGNGGIEIELNPRSS
uniref:Uncharacterized protein n=1 Tax=Arundo donax TaxID=35708 RepID=A0A0A8XYH7_ARUDO